MNDRPVLFIVAQQCPPELEVRLNDWWDKTHIPMLLKSQWLDAAYRYRLVPATAEGKCASYLTVYEFNDKKALQAHLTSPERQAAHEERLRTWGVWKEDLKMSWRAAYEPTGSWRK